MASDTDSGSREIVRVDETAISELHRTLTRRRLLETAAAAGIVIGGLALLLITHDLGVVASVADRVLVLDNGVICEQGPVAQLLARPKDDYTARLVAAAPSLTCLGDRNGV
jgi:peptide/nickel transport system ATP-binding protein